MKTYLSPPHLSEEGYEKRFLEEAVASNWIAPVGPQITAFEEELARDNGSRFAVAVSSGTAALHLALRVLGVERGDDVLCPTLTFVATASPVVHLGANPVFLDSDRGSWNLDPGLLEDELRQRAKAGARMPAALVAVDLYGQAADYEPIVELCERFGVPLLEDAAEALGATYRGMRTGNFGRAGFFSFNGNKIITTSGGGMLVTDDEAFASRVRHLATQARDPAPHYQHSEIGYNYRMSNLLAAVGRGQLRVLERRVRQRRANYEAYADALSDLPGLDFMPDPGYGLSTRWLTCITLDPRRFGSDPESIRLSLERLDIESRPIWKPLHLQPAFREARVRGGSVSEDIFHRGLCLPSGSSLSVEERDRVIRTVRSEAGVDPG